MSTIPVGNMDSVIELERIRRLGEIGIIAGSGPEAGSDLWLKVLQANRGVVGDGYRGDIDAPSIRMLSLPYLGLSMDMDCHANALRPVLMQAAAEMTSHCKAYTIACNTLHYFSDELKSLPGGKFVSVQDAVSDELEARSLDRFALLGAAPVMSLGKWSPYAALKRRFEIETGSIDQINRIVYAVKQHGGSTPQLENELKVVVDSLHSEVVVLGCTELPLIALPERYRERVIDVTSLLASALLRRLVQKSHAGCSEMGWRGNTGAAQAD